MLLHYAGNDERINKGIEAFEGALKANNKKYTKYMYEGAQHAFNSDANAARYNKAAADLAWGRTLAFLKEDSRRAAERDLKHSKGGIQWIRKSSTSMTA